MLIWTTIFFFRGLAEDVYMYYLCAMTGAIILTDHLHPQGAFHSKSPIRVSQQNTNSEFDNFKLKWNE
jgi:hypothetical protein